MNQALSLETLSLLDRGAAAVMLARQLKRAADDIYDRPGDPTPRKVTMEFKVVPVLLPNGSVETVETQIQVKTSIPTYKTPVYSMGVRPNGTFVFNEDSLDNVNQTTLFTAEEQIEE